ncbi:MAG: metalloregulator ArsR/SmtB family transcription factor [Candidatus Eisenbacteria bacterium]
MVNYTSTRRLDATFGALADPTRRAILARLARGPATIGELATPFAMSLPAVSKHVRVLEGAGLIARARTGREHHITLSEAPLIDAAQWIHDSRRFWEQSLDRLAEYLASPTTRTPTEESWPHRKPTPRPRTASSAPSRQRPRKSTKRGPRPKA